MWRHIQTLDESQKGQKWVIKLENGQQVSETGVDIQKCNQRLEEG